MEQFQFLSKVVQFWRFLILKIPEVRQAEEIETRNRRAEEDLDQNVDSSDFMKVHTPNLRQYVSCVQCCSLF
jgi:hypothetical protein